jgi:hypothetical protein
VILAAVASLAFLVVEVTALFVAAYIFTLFAIAVMLCGNLFLLNNTHTYPGGAALPQTALTYLVIEFIVSLLAVVPEQITNITIPAKWFVIAQVIILAAFAIRLILLNAGRTEIERVGDKVATKVFFIKLLQIEVEGLASTQTDTEVKTALKNLAEKIRYSDPVSSPQLAELEGEITSAVGAIGSATDKQATLSTVEKAAKLIDTRNRQCKLLK